MMFSVFVKRFREHAKAWIAFIAILTFLALSMGWIGIYQRQSLDTNPITDGHPLSDSRYGFQFYTPTYLPDGFHIVDKRISIDNPDGEVLGIGAELNLRSVDWVYAIREGRAGVPGEDAQDEGIVPLANNYDPTSITPTCQDITSPAGQFYRLCHWIDYGKINVFEVKFVKGGTDFWTEFPGTVEQDVPIASISRYVDSFRKAGTAGFPILVGGP